jgi:type II secretory pathway component PulK
MANKERGEVKIMLDKERTLKFNLNSLVLAEDMGVDLEKMAKEGKLKLKDMRTLLYVGLVHEDKELTPEKVGEMIDFSNIDEITEALNKAFNEVGK